MVRDGLSECEDSRVVFYSDGAVEGDAEVGAAEWPVYISGEYSFLGLWCSAWFCEGR